MSRAQQILPQVAPEIFMALTRELGFVPGRALRAVPAAAGPDVVVTAEAATSLKLSDVSTETSVALAEVPGLSVCEPRAQLSSLTELTAAPTLIAHGPARPAPVAADEAVPAQRSAGVVPPGLGSYLPHDEVVEEDSFDEPATVVLDLVPLEEIPQAEVAEVAEVSDVRDGTAANQADHPVDVADVADAGSFFARRVPSMPPIAQGNG
ncbi:hypothetical protein [Nocardioides sp.]|uniref:hypothetical protein n=1 Tax=Nocardioides sp. TaxID=35761 RepID=UPI002B27647D|nr:hypothetical protein [Nocardioides sp.]